MRCSAPGSRLPASSKAVAPCCARRTSRSCAASTSPARSLLRSGSRRDAFTVDNEANLAALAELQVSRSDPRRGAGQSFVYVTSEIGVGAGIVIDGELFRGVSGMAGELGHVSIERNGRPCGCGSRGCVERYAGQQALLAASRLPTVDALVAAVDARRPHALAAVPQPGRALGAGLASMLNVVDVPTVVLGGVFARVFDAVAPAVRAELEQRVLASDMRALDVRAGAHRRRRRGPGRSRVGRARALEHDRTFA